MNKSGWILAVITWLCCRALVAGDPYAPAWTAEDASRRAFQYNEAQRRWAFGQQLEWNQALRWRAAFPVWITDPLVDPLAYPPALPGASPWYGWRSPYLRIVPQPIGQRQIQTGENRWESHPVFADDPPPVQGPVDF